MRLLIFSDIHSDLAALGKLMETEADYYFAAGDMVNWGRGLEKAGSVLQRRGDRMYVIPGNHESESDIARLCDDYGFQNFHGKTIQVDGHTIGGLGYSNPTPFDTPGEYTEEQLSERLARFTGMSSLVMVCHCPPFGSKLDHAGEDRHLGSKAVREFIEREQPEYFFCGHVHEAWGASEQIGVTRAYNVGKKGYLLEL